jgi:hypothetical protein
MSELPKSWGLETRKNSRGTLDVIGKDDTGHEYKVRTTDAPAITETDVAEIAAVDRERTTAKEFVDGVVKWGRQRRESRETDFYEDLCEAAGPVVHAGLEREGATVGYSRKYAQNWEKVFK